LEWCNEHAEEEIFGGNSNFSRNITERSIFTLLLQSNILDRLTEGEEFIRFHMTLAKGRLSSSSLLSQGSELSQKHSDLLARLYHEVGAASDEEGILTIEINLTELHQGNDSQQHFNVYASFFREGIFFSYIPVTDEQQSLQSYLSRRDQVIAQLLRKRQPYLTPLAVVIADLQNSTKICAELPPEEYFDLINQVWGSMEPLLRKYRATHGKHAGDGVVYYFLPQADSNYALNAVQFTIEMKQIIKRLSREWQQKKNWFNELHLNVGIDEGTEWFGTYQTSTHIEFTALGDTVNQAGRLSDFAKNGSIWVSKRLMSNLPSTTRDKIHYGIRRESPGGEEHVISSTYSRVESLIKHDSLQWNKMHDIAMIAVTEIIDVSL
jgi:class 3 adenylate cyclase